MLYHQESQQHRQSNAGGKKDVARRGQIRARVKGTGGGEAGEAKRLPTTAEDWAAGVCRLGDGDGGV